MYRRLAIAACLIPLAMGLWQCDILKPKAPSPYASAVVVKFTSMAMASMVHEKDAFVVGAYYYGDPTPAALAKADKMGRLVLGQERVAWSNNTRRVKLPGAIDTSLLPQIRGEPQMMINVYSVTPEGASDELIACKSWIGSVKEAQAKPPVIGCELENGDKDSADDLVAAPEAASGAASSE